MTREQEKAMFAKKDAGKSYRKSYSRTDMPSESVSVIRAKAVPMTESDRRGFAGAPKDAKVYHTDNYAYIVSNNGRQVEAYGQESEWYEWSPFASGWVRRN